MSAQQTTETEEDEMADLLPEHLSVQPAKRGAVPVVRSKAAVRAQQRADAKAQREALDKANAVRLAQIVNLSIAGYSLAEIGAQIGATADEVDRLLQQDVSRYVRNQPALRTYVRNWVSAKYMAMIEADWEVASDPDAADKLDHQDRVMRMLNNMAKLHGAEAPVQSEIKVEHAPEQVERLVAALSAGRGLAYDESIFDVPPEDIHEAVLVSQEVERVSGNAVTQPQEGDSDEGL